ncbi:MAG: tripartite tricarboxylate transporter TctB family protein [Candidatus Competibacterales bacterium]
MRADPVVHGALLIGALVLFVQAGQLPASRWEPLGAGTFPRLVLGALVVLNGLALGRWALGWWRGQPRSKAAPWGVIRELGRRPWVVAVAFVGYCATLPTVGFVVASFGFVLLVVTGLGVAAGGAWRPWLVAGLALGLVLSVGLNVLFAEVFRVFLPRGTVWAP